MAVTPSRYTKGWRRVHVGGAAWSYRVGRRGGVVIHGPSGEQANVHAGPLRGQAPYLFERGQHKKTSDGAVKPSEVKLFIQVGLSLRQGSAR